MTQDQNTYAHPYQVAAFYRFVAIADPVAARQAIIDRAARTQGGVCGTILIAPEGINATIATRPDAMPGFIDFLDTLAGICKGELKYSYAPEKPFNRFKVRLKKEIITLRRPEADPTKRVGTYVSPQDWNAVITDPDVTVIDTRNDYETKVGIFKNAIDPGLSVFTEFPAWVEKNLNPRKHKKVAMFCTGGIRCEKASAYMLAQGFEDVYHLKGGILQYLEDVPADQSLWDGECFVFDKRVAIGHGLQIGRHSLCFNCRTPLKEEDCKSPSYEEGVSCPHCIASLNADRAKALRHRHKAWTQALAHSA